MTSPIDGPLREEYLAMGVTVIIDEAAALGHWTFENFARNFDLVVVSTLASAKAVEALGDSLPPVLWWIHEGSEGLKVFGEQLPKQIGRNVHPYFGGEYAQKLVSSFNPKFSGPVLNYGVDAIPVKQPSEEKGGRITFLIAGSYEQRKAQDVMAEAIRLANRKYMQRTRFIFVGRVQDENIFNVVCALCAEQENVEMMEPVPKSEMPRLYALADCIVAPSRDDPMPVVMTDGLSLRKVCICSDHTGTAHYIRDGENGFVFPSGDAEKLAEKIGYIVENSDRMQQLREQAFKTYEEAFTMEAFRGNILSVFSELIGGQK